MKVRDCYTIRKVNPDTGEVTFETGEREIETQDIENHDSLVAVLNYADIKAQLREADIAMLRSLYEGDQARIKAHLASQADLRKKLR